jgi:hypothetical protein
MGAGQRQAEKGTREGEEDHQAMIRPLILFPRG